jgi:hypothetical protein
MAITQTKPKNYKRRDIRKSGPAQSKLGKIQAENKLSEAELATLITNIARGVPISIACAAVGIHRETFYGWLDNRPEFAQALAVEKQKVIMEALTAVKTSQKDAEWRGWAWFLERVYRDHFAPPQPGINFAQQNNTFTITFEKANEINERRAKLLPEIGRRLGLTNGDTNGTGT